MLVAAASLLAAGCGGSDSSEPRGAEHSGARLGPPVRLANCRDWQQADQRERVDTVEAIRRFATGPTGSPGGRGASLDDRDAYALFDRTCKNRYARGFKLYKLYTSAAAFQPR